MPSAPSNCVVRVLEKRHADDFPEMYTSPELQAATDKLISNAKKNDKILGLFLFGTDRVEEFLKKDFTFISIGNDLHHILTQTFAHKEALIECAKGAGKSWAPTPCAMPFGMAMEAWNHNPQ